jgi:hypothetical protein
MFHVNSHSKITLKLLGHVECVQFTPCNIEEDEVGRKENIVEEQEKQGKSREMLKKIY